MAFTLVLPYVIWFSLLTGITHGVMSTPDSTTSTTTIETLVETYSKDYIREPDHESYSKCSYPCFCKEMVNHATMKVVRCGEDSGLTLDALLGSNLNVTALIMDHLQLEQLPEQICHMVNLTWLQVNYNTLTDLPWTCLKQLQYLTMINATGNQIKALHNGSLYDFPSLVYISLGHNHIHTIDVDVFANVQRVPSLKVVWLNSNMLSSVDPWPTLFIGRTVNINLESNQISHFTNHLQLKFKCPHSGGVNSIISFHTNKITHFTDVLKGWNISGTGDIMCLLLRSSWDFRNNGFICDCIDFRFYTYLKMVKRSKYWIDLHCVKPASQYGVRLASLPLDKVVCEVDEDCPSECQCIEQPNQMNMSVTCNKSSELPLSLPALLKHHYRYHLNFTGSNLTSVEFRPYFLRTRNAIFSHNSIRNVSLDALTALYKAETIFLDENNLKYLPINISTINLTTVGDIHLAGNDWVCDCRAKETRSWMIEMQRVISDKDSILCRTPQRLTGTNLLQLSEDQLICGDLLDMVLIAGIVPTVLATFLMFLLSLFLIIKKKKVWFYKKFHIHWFDKDECEGEEKEFDVFVSYAEEDSDFVLDGFVPELEVKGYKVALANWNSDPMYSAPANIEKFIRERSKRTLVVLSDKYMSQPACMWEFILAFQLDFEQRKKRLIVMKYGGISLGSLDTLPETTPDGDSIPPELTLTFKTYFNNFAYVKHGVPDFWEQLEYLLPVHKIAGGVIGAPPDIEMMHHNLDEQYNDEAPLPV